MTSDLDSSSLFGEPKIAMSVVLVTLNKRIDLETLAAKTINAHYEKKRFAACIIRTDIGTGLFFATGTLVITFGHLDLQQTIEDLYMNKIQVIDRTVRKTSSKIVNTTVACSVSSKVYLNRIIRSCKRKRDVQAHFELFPGLSKSLTVGNNDKIKITVFGSGRYNILGCKSREEIDEAYEYTKKWILDFINLTE